ncbi:MAG: U32 family peptidase [Clostridium sp.]|nr:U32 family peptidase [Clostridium sp.]
MNKIEVLAPAGTIESLYAAINKGADAVYLGGNKFSARAYASNFDNENMQKAIDYAHSYGVKIYVTINTILKENEIEEAVRYVGYLYEIGADALIIQDLGLFKRIKEEYPDLELHASTQMTIHNGEAAIYFKEKGFHRLVLSREMTIEEIKHISTDLNIETEMFVHGAICVSYSGQCLMSSIIGGRSGNRGRCAQPCRMEYTLKGEKSGEQKGHLLSPKDMCTIDDVKDIVESGTHSLKIEGRMKRPEYVAGVVDNYRKAVDKVLFKTKYNVQEGKGQLLQLFNRSGFTNAYLKGNTGKDMMSFNSPKNAGVPLGLVDKAGEIKLKESLSLGDGIRYRDKGFSVSKILLNGKEVTSANRGDVVKLFPIDYKKGDELFKSLNKQLFDDLEDYIKPYNKKISLDAKVKFIVDSPIEITILHNNKEYIFTGEVVQKAEKRPLDKERVEEALKKSGDVPFKLNKIEFTHFEDGFLRIADLNNLRRDAFEGIIKSICKESRRKRPKKEDKKSSPIKQNNTDITEVYSCITKEQLQALLDSNVKNIAFDIFSREMGALRASDIIDTFEKYSKDLNLYVKTSSIIKGEFDRVCSSIDKVKPYIKGLITSNIGLINVYKDSLMIIGDYKLNIMNSQSLAFYQNEITIPTLSMELNRGEIKEILRNNKGNNAYVIYGKPELMISEYCPIGSTFGGRKTNVNCNAICTRDRFTLIDRVNERNRVMTDLFCRSYILNPVPLNLFDEVNNLKEIGIKTFRFDFRDESYEDVIKVLNMYRNSEDYDRSNYTKGQFRRGIE